VSENLDLVRSIYADWERGDYGSAEWADPEFEYVNPGGAVEPATQHGPAGVSRVFVSIFDAWDAWHVELERLTASGDQVAVVVCYRRRGRESGVEVEGRESHLWTLRNGKVVRVEWFHDPAAALADLGLQE
jgi:ketosteroid isomerase-like protein